MKLGEAKTKAIQLINEYSNNGNLISSSTNADYSLRMNGLAQSAQTEIAAIRRIDGSQQIVQTGTDRNAPGYKSFVRYAMPADFMKLHQIVYEDNKGGYHSTGNYRWEGKKTLVLPSELTGTFMVEYFKYPMEITDTTTDDYVFELEPDACEAIPFYIGAFVSMDEPDKQGVSTKLLNLYQQRLANLDDSKPQGLEFIQNVNGW